MKYYIDFEASEYEHKIISIGCINEKGEEFYSLVYCDDPITPRIEEITGITQEDIDNAPSGKDVFSRLYDWCYNEEELPEFICYGSSDPEFVCNTFYGATGFKEAAILGYLYLNMYDCSEEIKKHFYVNKTISLEKLGQHYDEEMGDQTHNALDDARLLKMVYEKMKSGNKENNVFNEYLDKHKVPSVVSSVIRLQGDQVVQEYADIKEAAIWVKSQPSDKNASYFKDAEEKIRKAAFNGSKYFGYYWRIL